VIILCGKLQAGKSTTINALLHGALKKGRDEKGKPAFSPPDGVVINDNNWAEGGGGLHGCTKLPRGYIFPYSPNTVLVDTRGFFDDRNKYEEVACSLLMTSIVKRAKSVSLVFLIPCKNFFDGSDGTSGMKDCGKIIGEILHGNKVPVLFLFNNYQPQDMDEYETMPKDPVERQAYVIDKMKTFWSFVWKDNQSQNVSFVQNLMDKLKSYQARVGLSGSDKEIKDLMEKDPEYKGKMQDQQYLNMLSDAFGTTTIESSKSCVCYIDPASNESIDDLRRLLSVLPSAPKELISFKKTSASAIEFERKFAEAIPKFLSLQTAIDRINKYPSEVTQALINSRSKQLSEYEVVLNSIGKASEEVLAQYEKQYGENAFEEKAKALRTRATKFTNQAAELKKDADELMNGKPVEVGHDNWDVCDLNPKHKVEFHYERPFQAVVSLEDGTREEEVIKKDPHDFVVLYAAGGFKNKAIVAGGSLGYFAVAGTAAALIKDPSFVAEATKNAPDVLKMLSESQRVHCKGKVSFVVKSKDVPEHIKTVERQSKEADLLIQSAKEANEELEKFKQAASASLSSKVEALKRSVENEKTILEEFEPFRRMVLNLMKENAADLQMFYRTACVLYDKDQRSTNTTQFIRIYEAQQAPKSGVSHPSDVVLRNACIEEFDIRGLRTELSDHFGDGK